MKPVNSGIFGIGRSRARILSALECLAWFPEYFPRVVEILARLSYRKIDDNRSATPKNTLRSLFRFWMPDADAAIEQRMRALDGLVVRHPEIGWWVSLCVARRPRVYGIIPRCYRPQWRGDRSHTGRPTTLDQDHRLVRKARDICLNWPMHTEKTLGDLVEGLEELDEPARQAVCDLLDRWVDEPQSDQAKGSLRGRVRRCAYTRGFRASATGGRIRRAMTKLAPGDLVVRHRWLFASASPRHGIDDADSSLDQITAIAVHVQRPDALRDDLETSEGFNGLNDLCRHGNATRIIGSLMPENLGGTQEAIPFVRWCLDKMSEDSANRYESCLESFLAALDTDSLPALADEIGRSHGEMGRLRLLVSMPYRKAWKLLETESDAFRSAYWEKVGFGPGRYPAGDIQELVDRLLEAGRPIAALQAVSPDWDAVETSRLTKLLHALARVGAPFHRLYGSRIPDMFKSLDRRADVTIEEKAKIEFMFLRVLDGSEYGMPNLARQIMSSPAWYAEAVIRASNRGDGRPTVGRRRGRGHGKFVLTVGVESCASSTWCSRWCETTVAGNRPAPIVNDRYTPPSTMTMETRRRIGSAGPRDEGTVRTAAIRPFCTTRIRQGKVDPYVLNVRRVLAQGALQRVGSG